MSGQRRPGRRCPGCGFAYGAVGVRCYPGIPEIMAVGEGSALAGWCQDQGDLGVPGPTSEQIVKVVKDLRAAGATWEYVRGHLRRFGLNLPPDTAPPMRPTVRGVWPPKRPEQGRGGPRPPAGGTSRRSPRGDERPGQPDDGGTRDRSPRRPPSQDYCPESTTGRHYDGTRTDGTCAWCEYRYTTPQPRPDLRSWRTELDAEYRRTYDPDYGTDPHDT